MRACLGAPGNGRVPRSRTLGRAGAQMMNPNQSAMVNEVWASAHEVCEGRLKLTKKYNPEPGESPETTRIGQIKHKALMGAVVEYAMKSMREDFSEGGRAPPSYEWLHRAAVDFRNDQIVD